MKLKVIKVETTYCSQCKMQEKELLLLNPYLKEHNIELIHLNADDDFDFAVEHHIDKVPAILILDSENNKEHIRFTGFTKADEIKKQLSFFLQGSHE